MPQKENLEKTLSVTKEETVTDQGSEQYYNELFDLFMAVSEEDLTYCNIPLETASAEGKQLAIVAAQDRSKLLDAGMDPVFVDTLEKRAGAFTYAAAKYELVVNADPEANKQWKELSPKGFELQKYLSRMYTFAFRKDKELTQSLEKVKEGRSSQDMILDLLTYSILGGRNIGLLEKMKMFDQSKITEAKELHNKLSDIYARSTIDPKEVSEAKKALDHAYTYYKLAADEVKAHGQFVFEGTDRYQSYVSDYHSNLRKMAAKSEEKTTA